MSHCGWPFDDSECSDDFHRISWDQVLELWRCFWRAFPSCHGNPYWLHEYLQLPRCSRWLLDCLWSGLRCCLPGWWKGSEHLRGFAGRLCLLPACSSSTCWLHAAPGCIECVRLTLSGGGGRLVFGWQRCGPKHHCGDLCIWPRRCHRLHPHELCEQYGLCVLQPVQCSTVDGRVDARSMYQKDDKSGGDQHRHEFCPLQPDIRSWTFGFRSCWWTERFFDPWLHAGPQRAPCFDLTLGGDVQCLDLLPIPHLPSSTIHRLPGAEGTRPFSRWEGRSDLLGPLLGSLVWHSGGIEFSDFGHHHRSGHHKLEALFFFVSDESDVFIIYKMFCFSLPWVWIWVFSEDEDNPEFHWCLCIRLHLLHRPPLVAPCFAPQGEETLVVQRRDSFHFGLLRPWNLPLRVWNLRGRLRHVNMWRPGVWRAWWISLCLTVWIVQAKTTSICTGLQLAFPARAAFEGRALQDFGVLFQKNSWFIRARGSWSYLPLTFEAKISRSFSSSFKDKSRIQKAFESISKVFQQCWSQKETTASVLRTLCKIWKNKGVEFRNIPNVVKQRGICFAFEPWGKHRKMIKYAHG